VVESATAKPVALSVRCPLEVAVRLYPENALVATVMSWAEIFGSTPDEVGRAPKLMDVVVAAIPLLVVSEFVHPVALPVLIAVASAIPAIVNVRVGSTVAWTCTDSTVPILVVPLSKLTLPESCVVTVNVHLSAVPAEALLVGFINLGACVVQEVSLLDVSEHPIRKVIVVPPATAPPESTVQVIEGAETVKVQVRVPSNLYEIFAAAFPEVSPLKENSVADGLAIVTPEPGKVSTIFPEAGIDVGI